MADTEAIMVSRPVYNHFLTILTQTCMTSNSLMEHFFNLYNSSLKSSSSENVHMKESLKGDNYNKIVLNIPKKILRRDISVNVTVQGEDQCMTSDGEDSSEDNLSSEISIGQTDLLFLKENLMDRPGNPETERLNKNKQKTYRCKLCTFKTKGINKYKCHLMKHTESQYHRFPKTFRNQTKQTHHVNNSHVTLTTETEERNINDWPVTGNNSENMNREKMDAYPINDLNPNNIEERGDNLKLCNLMEDNSYNTALNNDVSVSATEFQHYTDMNNLTVNTRIKNMVIDKKLNTKQRFLCSFCLKPFWKFNDFWNHRDYCWNRRYNFICHCKLKFKWKSQFLYHKSKCASRRCYSAKYRQMKKRYVNGTTCNANLMMDLDDSMICRSNNGLNMMICSEPLNNSANHMIDTCTSNSYQSKTLSSDTVIDSAESTTDTSNNGPNTTLLLDTGRINKVETSFLTQEVSLKSRDQQNCSAVQETQDSNCIAIEHIKNGNNHLPNGVATSSNELDNTCHNKLESVTDGKFNQVSEDYTVEQSSQSYLNDAEMYMHPNPAQIHCSEQQSVTTYQNTDNKKLNFQTAMDDRKCETQIVGDNSYQRVETFDNTSCFDLSLVKTEPEQVVQNRKPEDDRSSNSLQNISSTDNFRCDMGDNNEYIFSYSGGNTEVNLKCEECGEVFKQKAYLKEHIEGKHSRDMRYSCDCGKKFKWRSSLGNHRKHCYQALLLMPQEGHNQGQNISVVDLSQYSISNVNLQQEWEKKIESMSRSVSASHDNLSAKFDHVNRQRQTSPEKPKVSIQRRKSEGTTIDTDLRINSALVKPIADALSRYQQKQQVDNTSSDEALSKYQQKQQVDTTSSAEALSKYHQKQQVDNTSRTARTSEQPLKPSTNVHLGNSSGRNILNSLSNCVVDLTEENPPNIAIHNNRTTKANSTINYSQEHILSEKYQTEVQTKVSECLQSVQVDRFSQPEQRKSANRSQDIFVECNLCREKFLNAEELERHKIFCRHLQDTCSVCGKIFQHRTELVNHLLTFHGNDEIYTCFCGLRSADWKSFEKHCEKCEDFKNQSSCFLLPAKVKRSQSDTKHLNTALIDLGLNTVSDTISTSYPYEYRVNNQSSRTETAQAETQPSIKNKRTNFPTMSHTQNLNMKLFTNDSLSYPNNSNRIIQNSGNKTTMANKLPTISSFVNHSNGSVRQHEISHSVESTNQIHLTKRDNSSTSVPKQMEDGKKDVFVCTFCGNVYNNVEKFSQHYKLHHMDKFNIPKFSKKQKSAVELAMDKSRLTPAKMSEHVCHLCGDVFAAKAYLKEHVSGKHGTVDRYTCPCGMRFKWRSSLGIHQKKCSKSNKRTYNRWNSS